jgi:hypothetical protein
MNSSKRLLSYLQNPEGFDVYFFIDDDYLNYIYEGKEFDPIEDRIKFCESIGNPCIISLGDLTRYIPELSPNISVLSENDENIVKGMSINTPLGKKGWLLRHNKNTIVERISEASSTPVSSVEDLQLFEWFYEVVKKTSWSECIKDLRQKVEQIGDRGITQIFMCPPFELLYWVKRQDMFLLYFDYPEEYLKAMDQVIDAYKIILSVAKEAGIQTAFYGAPGGMEFTSPSIWKEAIVPSSIKLEKHIKEYGMHSIFHCCGKISKIIQMDFLNQISPTVYETYSPPPVGDAADLSKMRGLTDRSIISHGNIDLTFLRDASQDQIIMRVMEILEETKGYCHILGPSDSCIWPGTPPENIKAVCELFTK